jgi:hypothetical protein
LVVIVAPKSVLHFPCSMKYIVDQFVTEQIDSLCPKSVAEQSVDFRTAIYIAQSKVLLISCEFPQSQPQFLNFNQLTYTWSETSKQPLSWCLWPTASFRPIAIDDNHDHHPPPHHHHHPKVSKHE